MINPSSFLSRALLADAVFSGLGAIGFAFGAGMLATFLNLPEALLRETGLTLICSQQQQQRLERKRERERERE